MKLKWWVVMRDGAVLSSHESEEEARKAAAMPVEAVYFGEYERWRGRPAVRVEDMIEFLRGKGVK